MMAAATLLLRFDGSFRGGCGGAGAVLLAPESGRVEWQGARFLPRCSSSAAAEYEGLLLGLAAAKQTHPGAALHIEGDCHLVLCQLSGRANSRKLSKLHARAQKALEQLELPCPPTTELLPRDCNGHADALSRAAIEARQALEKGAILGSTRAGRRRHALEQLQAARQERVPFDASFVETVLAAAHADRDWHVVLSLYAEARDCKGGAGERSLSLAIEALEALAATGSSVGRQLNELRRQQVEHARRARRDAAYRPMAAGTSFMDDAGTGDAPAESAAQSAETKRAAAAGSWRAAFEREAGGCEALTGNSCAPDAVPRLRALAEQLSSPSGFGIVTKGGDALLE
mmetsp:Transcript_3787/g.9949  ORF Transcript_3787/g.9949 Transcript_3787/m.9949 type:complete len:344 (+) Transcript_3787:134-1165(+)